MMLRIAWPQPMQLGVDVLQAMIGGQRPQIALDIVDGLAELGVCRLRFNRASLPGRNADREQRQALGLQFGGARVINEQALQSVGDLGGVVGISDAQAAGG